MEGNHLEDIGVAGRIKLIPTFEKWYREVRSGLIWLRIGTDGGNKLSGSIKYTEFPD